MAVNRFEKFLYTFVGIIVVLRLTAFYVDHRMHSRPPLIDATPTPVFTWRDFESEPHSIKDLKGKTIVLHFWASWCGPCRNEFPYLLQAANSLGKDVVFLTVSSDDDDKNARRFVDMAKRAAGVSPDNVLYAFDPMKYITFDTFQTMALPETILIDPELRMRRKFAGTVLWQSQELLDLIHNLKTLPISTTNNPIIQPSAAASTAKVPVPK